MKILLLSLPFLLFSCIVPPAHPVPAHTPTPAVSTPAPAPAVTDQPNTGRFVKERTSIKTVEERLKNEIIEARTICGEFTDAICNRISQCGLAEMGICSKAMTERCAQVFDMRDPQAFREQCIPRIRDASCDLIKNPSAFMARHPSCQEQFRGEQASEKSR